MDIGRFYSKKYMSICITCFLCYQFGHNNGHNNGQSSQAGPIKERNEKIKESIITPIVIGILMNLKLINIKAADIDTRIDDISNMLILTTEIIKINHVRLNTQSI